MTLRQGLRDIRVRVTPELIDVANEESRWSQPYDTVMSDVFAVQAAIASRVAEALNVALAPPVQGQSFGFPWWRDAQFQLDRLAAMLARALALAFAHGPLAGTAPALAAEREGPVFRVRVSWALLEGSVALEARGTSPELCQERIARLMLLLWQGLEEAASWL